MVTSAARISSGWVDSDSLNACAVPANVPRTDTGTPSSAIALRTASVASDSATPIGRLKLMVVAGAPPWWLTDSGVLVSSMRANAASGTWAPVLEMNTRLRSDSGLCKNSGASSITTRYWFSGL